jgi:hypothetical protein
MVGSTTPQDWGDTIFIKFATSFSIRDNKNGSHSAAMWILEPN